MKSNWQRTAKLAIAWGLLGGVVISSIGCGIIRPTRGRRGEAVTSGFLGDYSQLAPREGYPAQEIYINPAAQWSKYNAVYIESTTLWATSESAQKLSKEDQKMLTDMMYKSIHDKLSEKFQIADRPGPNVIKMRMALTEAQGAKVALNVVTTVVPQLRAVSTVVGLGADTASIVGSARA